MHETGMLSWALLGMLILFGILGAVGAIFAWRMALREPEREPKIEVLAGIGGGLVTGIAIGVSALFLEVEIGESQKDAAWRANIEIAAVIPGFTPGDRDVKDINFSGKVLRDADFTGAELKGVRFRDADLRGAVFDNAKMQDAELIGANLEDSSLKGADLTGAKLESANLTGAIVNVPKTTFKNAHVDKYTCWPVGVDRKKVDAATIYKDNVERYVPVPESPEGDKDKFLGGQPAPHCDKWKHGKLVR
ncbi:pentapeptide repeat-containing protein [Streptomyces xantholiticus]|uniref:Pentapeptide repeat-containing protein n=1 Tax=Streptomyces xantholiticus TaxID=68285 RepID=A0ABV1V818_9ACTN